MGQTLTIARRETLALFFSPIAYVAVSCFMFVIALVFTAFVFKAGEPSDLTNVFIVTRFALFLVTPLVTMSLFSEEFKSGRIEMLRTSPISPFALVLGKYLGGLCFFVAMVASLLVFVVSLSIFGGPDYHMLMASFLGLLLMGMLYVSVGLFFSACTQSQLLAAVGAFLMLTFMNLAGDLMAWFGDQWRTPGWLRTGVLQSTVGYHFNDFTKGKVDLAHVLYFTTVGGFFLFLTYLVMESRNWRR